MLSQLVYDLISVGSEKYLCSCNRVLSYRRNHCSRNIVGIIVAEIIVVKLLWKHCHELMAVEIFAVEIFV